MTIRVLWIVWLAAALSARAEIPVTIRSAAGTMHFPSITLDNPEPDTLAYDDRGNNYLIGSVSDYYVFTRFTPAADFQLRSIYLGIRDDVGSAMPCSVWVHLANGSRPGAELAGVAIAISQGTHFMDVTLPEPLNFNGGENFFIVLGMSPGYSAGWSPIVDGSSSSGRSSITLDDRVNGPWQTLPVDVRIRAGGSLTAYGDLSALECYNHVNHGGPAFFVLPGDTIRLSGRIANVSAQHAEHFTANWTVSDDQGNVYYQDSLPVNGLDAGAETALSAPSAFIAAGAARLNAVFSLVYAEDADSSNNSTLLRMPSGSLPGWYGYNDMNFSGASAHDPGWRSGISFKPAQFPAKVDSVLIGCGSESTAEIQIYRNDGQDRPGGEPVRRQTANFNVGMNVLAISPPLRVDSGASFTVAYVYGPNSSLAFDTEPPSAAAMTNMGSIAWLYGPDGWQADISGNFLIQAFLDTVSDAAGTDRRRQSDLAANVELLPNYPNPFNPQTTIRYFLPQSGRIRLDVLNINGERVATLLNGEQAVGYHELSWNARGFSSGIYLYCLRTERGTRTQRMQLLK